MKASLFIGGLMKKIWKISALIIVWALVGAGVALYYFNKPTPEPLMQEGQPFDFEMVRAKARGLAASPYMPQKVSLPEEVAKLDYDQHRDVRFQRDKGPWFGQQLPFEIQLFHLGSIFTSPVKINGQNVELWSETSTEAVQIPYVQAATNVDTVTDCYFVDDTDGTLMAINGTEPVTTLKLSQCTDQTLVLSGGVGYIAQSDGSSADLSKPVYTKTGGQYTVTPAVEADSPSTRIGIVLKGSVLPNKTVEVLV